ncbi:glycosyltransferase family 4 protein [Dyadobacter luticola]|uniref:Glycosyltransferase family 4 protein n=1 Tax=Dyadobacter luticola TaxID=1979387 RepID=A0A5R9L646_9BACT|nr:glycosyltransferase family 4 protein [Dyadobacter luticola]TLV03715.1 glycosyltransferase family 4 protein [Dyadobacter luticola]
MRILWVNPSFLDYRIPVYKKLNELSGGNFHIVYSKNRVPERIVTKIEEAIGANAVGMEDEKTFGYAKKGDFANTDINIPYQPGLFKAITKVNADIILGEGFFQWTPLALLGAKLKGKKFLIAYEKTAYTERNCPRWRTMYRQIISKFVNGYSVNGHLTTEYLAEIGVDRKKIFLGGMSADSENLVAGIKASTKEAEDELKAKLSITGGLTYLYAGQIIERKGVIYLLNAWKQHIKNHPDDNLVMIGTGPLLEEYQKQFAEYKSIKLLGMIDYDTIYKYYAIADVFIIPTIEDNWSLVVPEAMACGLPIASSIYNGCYPELVQEDVNGKLFDPLKEDTIVNALDYFHHQDLAAMGRRSMEIERGYNADAIADKIFDSLKTVYAGGSAKTVTLNDHALV